MRRTLLVLLALPLSASAQDFQLANNGALLFNMGGLFSTAPAAFDGIGVGAKYFPDSAMGFRGALGFNFTSAEVDPPGDGSVENDTKQIAAEGGLEFVLARSKKAYLYTGAVGQLAYQSNDPEGTNDSSGFAITAAGLLGANYFLLDGLSVGAEYRAGIQYASQTQESAGGDTDTSTLTLGVGAVAFHLGFWFGG